MAETLVAVEGLRRLFGNRMAVDGVDMTLRAGDVRCLLGPNGAGKTTTLRMLAGLLRPDAGGGQVLGLDLVGRASEVAASVGYMAQRFSPYAELTVAENLRFRAAVHGLTRPQARAAELIETFALGPFARTRAGALSGGLGRRLQFALALVQNPRLILLDEPTAGLDPEGREAVWLRIDALAAEGRGLIVSTHDFSEPPSSRSVSLFHDGRIVSGADAAPAQAVAC